MRIGLTIDDDLLRKAQALSGIQGRFALVREAISVRIERESARRLARLRGSEPGLSLATRRRSEPDGSD
jgi:hypothetical protein